LEEVNEKTFYQDSNVLVTNSRLIINGKTYAIRNISSVANQEIPNNFSVEATLITIGLILLIFRTTRIIGILLIAGAIFIAFTHKNNFSVRINSNAGEIDGLISKDKEYVQKIVTAINDSIVYRG
jgi:hypothetical protein